MFCPNCGTQNSDDALFCANCGFKLQASEPAPAPAPAPVEEPAPAAPPVAEPVPVAPPVAEPVPAAPPVAEPVPAAPPVAEPVPAAPPVAEPVPAAPPVSEPAPVAPPVAEPAPAAPPVTEPAPAPTPQEAPKTTPQAGPAPAAKEEKKGKSKLFIIIGAAAAAVVLIAVVAIFMLGKLSQSGGKIADYFDTWYDDNNDQTYITYKGKSFSSWFEGNAYVCGTNADNTVALFMCGDDLYVGDSKYNLKRVHEDVQYYAISYNGDVIAFVDDDDDLYTYNTKNGAIASVSSDNTTAPVLSPSGKTILYVSEDDGDDILYAYIGKKSFKIARDVSPMACSDNGKYIYYYDSNKGAIYVSDKNNNTNKLGTGISWGSNALFTKDMSKIMFSTDDGVYVCVNGGDKEEVYSKDVSLTPLSIYKGDAYEYNFYGQGSSLVYGATSFGNAYYITSDSDLIYLDAKMQSNKIAGNMYDYDCDKEMKNFFYMNSDGTLYYTKLGSKLDAQKVADDIIDFAVGKGTTVYYINEDDALYMTKGAGKGKKIADDVETMDVTHDNICLFTCNSYNNECELYQCTGTAKKMITDECYTYYLNPGSTMYLSNYDSASDSFDLYITQKGTNFWNVLTEVCY